jgi:hypothetical protein
MRGTVLVPAIENSQKCTKIWLSRRNSSGGTALVGLKKGMRIERGGEISLITEFLNTFRISAIVLPGISLKTVLRAGIPS